METQQRIKAMQSFCASQSPKDMYDIGFLQALKWVLEEW